MKCSAILALLVAVAALVLGPAVTPTTLGWKGKPPQDESPPELPPVRYSIDLVAERPGGFSVVLYEVNNWGMVAGRTRENDVNSPILYNPFSAQPLLHLNSKAALLDQLPAGFVFRNLKGINDRGDLVGSIVDYASGETEGVVIETGLSDNPNDWIVHAVVAPTGSVESMGLDINVHGDVLGYYQRPDGTFDRFLYNPWTDTAESPNPPMPLGLSTPFTTDGVLNNNAQVVVAGPPDTISFVDAATSPPTIELIHIDGAQSGVSINDAGIFAGVALSHQINGKGKAYNVLYRHSGQLEIVVKASSYLVSTDGQRNINSSDDLCFYDEANNGIHLVHTGFSPDFTEQIWNLDDLIPEDDPLRSIWDGAYYKSIMGMNDRGNVDDASGYPQLIVHLYTPTGFAGVVLTPHDIP